MYASGDGVESCAAVVWGSDGGLGASGCSMWLRAAVWYSDQVSGRVTTMSSVRRMWCHVGASSCVGCRPCIVWNWERNAWVAGLESGCCSCLRSASQWFMCVSRCASWADQRGFAMTGGCCSCAIRRVTRWSTGRYIDSKSTWAGLGARSSCCQWGKSSSRGGRRRALVNASTNRAVFVCWPSSIWFSALER